jgi:hypothetical protein
MKKGIIIEKTIHKRKFRLLNLALHSSKINKLIASNTPAFGDS